jgi:tetratricopeptide (TPR) repeat protein
MDEDTLTRTLPYILFWKEIEGKTTHPTLISQQLVYLSGTLWITHAQPMKGFKLMQVAKELCDFHDRQPLHNAIAHELKIATAFAKHYSFFDLLCLIHNAIEYFHVTTVELGSPGEAANQIADAHFLFNQKRYEEAERRVKWALCLDPTNIAALRLLGLTHFQQGKYAQAVENLQKLPASDFQIAEIIGICLIKSDKTSQGQDLLKRISPVHPLSDDSLYLLGSREDQPEWAIHWLAAIKHPNPEVLARLFISYHTMKNWHSAIEVYHQLSPPYSKLYALQRMAVDCFIALNKKDFAEDLLEAMQMEESPSTSQEQLS